MKKSTTVNLVIAFIVIAVVIILNVYLKSPSQTDTIALNKNDIIASDLIKKDSDYKLVFFGYAGCYHFCDPRLHQIDTIYKELKNDLDLKMLFVDISTETTHKDAESFAKNVNSEFETISPDAQNITLLQKKFKDVFISKMPDGDYLHSGFLYLLKKDAENYYLIKTYMRFAKSGSVIADIKKVLGR